MSGESYAAAVARIAGILATARRYPPNRNDKRRKCEACRNPVPAYAGWLLAGSDGGQEFGVCVHACPCLADIRAAAWPAAGATGS